MPLSRRDLLVASSLLGLAPLGGCVRLPGWAGGTRPSIDTQVVPPVDVTREAPSGPHGAPEAMQRVGAKVLASMSDVKACVSPLSLMAAFGAFRNGCVGRTGGELDELWGLPADEVNAGMNAVLQDVLRVRTVRPGVDDAAPPEVALANALWVQRGMKARKPFAEALMRWYAAEVRSADFRGDAGRALAELNDWGASVTRDKIRDMVTPDMLTPQTSLVLANALYFKGGWTQEVHKSTTRPEPFLVQQRQVPVPTMHLSSGFWAESPTYEATSVFVAGEDFRLALIRPRNDTSTVLKEIATRGLAGIIGGRGGDGIVNISLPKWKASTSLDPESALRGLGVTRVFAPGTEIQTVETDQPQQVAARHRVETEVDEEGMSGAATTVIAQRAGAAPNGEHEQPKERSLKLDREFLYCLYAVSSGAPLFLGRVGDPTKA